MLSKKL